MSALTWADLSQRKMHYVCTQGIDRWEYCRAIGSHLRLQQEIEQWMVAAFIGTAFLLVSLAVSMLLADRRRRHVVDSTKTRAFPARIIRQEPVRQLATPVPALA